MSANSGTGMRKLSSLLTGAAASAAAVATAAAAAVLLAGCATSVTVQTPDMLAATGAGARMYVAAPLAEHESLVRYLASSADLSGKSSGAALDPVLDRASVLYAGVHSDRLSLVITGDFPRNAAVFAFPSSAGWKKKSAKSRLSWYERGSVRAAIPAAGIVLITVERAGSTVERAGSTVERAGSEADEAGQTGAGRNAAASPDTAAAAAVRPAILDMMDALSAASDSAFEANVSPSFRAFARNAEQDGRIGMFVADPSDLEKALFGSLLEIPVARAEIYAVQNRAAAANDDANSATAEIDAGTPGASAENAPGAATDSEAPAYLVSAKIELADPRTVRAFSMLLKLALGSAVSASGTTLSVDAVPVSASALADAARFLYF